MKKLSDRFLYYSGILCATGMNVDVNDLVQISALLEAEEQGLLREVKKGKWIRVNVQKSWGKSTKIVCSICEKKSWLNYDFCPNCGADMREEYQNAND